MWKLLLTSFLTNFVNEILAAKVGALIFKGKGVITKSDETGTNLDLYLKDGMRYEITIKKI